MIAAAPCARACHWPVVLVALLAAALVACTNPSSSDRQAGARSEGSQAAKPQAARESTGPPDATPTPDRLKYPRNWTDITSSRDRTVAEERRDDPKNAAVRAQLDRVLPEVNFDAVPFTDVVDFFRDRTRANIFINWRALENAGIDRKAPVTARLRNVKFSKALSVVFDSLSGGTVPLDYTIDDGVITVSTGEDLDRDTITRVYDVRDLIIPIPDFQPPPAHAPPVKPKTDEGLAAERAWLEANGGAHRVDALDQLTRLLTETVAPHSWRDAGGNVGSVRDLQGQLIITQKPENHRQIAALLDHLREARGVQIVLETRLIAADDDLLDALPAGLREKVAGQLRAGKDPVAAPDVEAEPKTPDDKAPPAGVFLTAAEVDRVLRALQASKRSHIVTAPRITLFNGQSAYVLLMKQRAYVADYTIVKANDAQTKFEPLFGTAGAGIMLSARATASADRTHATVSLHPRLTHLAGIKEIPWRQAQAPGAENLTVQRPDLLVSELRCTVSIPTNQTLLLGGLKGAVDLDGAKEAADKTQPRNVIMLVKPTVIVQREIEMKAAPMKQGR